MLTLIPHVKNARLIGHPSVPVRTGAGVSLFMGVFNVALYYF